MEMKKEHSTPSILIKKNLEDTVCFWVELSNMVLQNPIFKPLLIALVILIHYNFVSILATCPNERNKTNIISHPTEKYDIKFSWM